MDITCQHIIDGIIDRLNTNIFELKKPKKKNLQKPDQNILKFRN